MRHLTLLLLLLSATLPALAEERILEFSSDVTVHPSGVLTVTENITVRAEGNQIRRGIYRDFPTIYSGRNGLSSRVTFVPVSAQLDDEPVNYFTEDISNGVRLYMGDKNRQLKRGIYRFTLTYRTDRQLGYFESHDELYWNVNGNGWNFPIDMVEATVHLPPGVESHTITHEAYTGAFGYKGQAYQSQIDDEGNAYFQTTQSLAREEGLTVVVGWPKGFVVEPSGKDRMEWFLDDNGNVIAGLIGLGLLLLYYG
ncbi:MAG: DUF2207 domain-containing protein, partial [Chromatiales bacterium]|nr:DUF2207 domain-containing protein [Chromatiales bacterium]